MRRIPFLLAVLPAFPAGILHAQQQPDLAAFDAYVAEARSDWNVPGMAVAIVKDGEVIFAKGYGVRELGGSAQVDEHTLFAVASNTKAFTTAALAMMVDQGRLSWDDRVQQHLPWFEVYDPWVSREMRVRDLLSHRSGLGVYSGDILWWAAPYPAEEVVRRARHLPAAGPFRASYNYNNLMFVAAGEVLAAASGIPWHRFVRDSIFVPLGMTRSVTTIDSLAARDNVATPHKSGVVAPSPIRWHSWNAMGAAGAVISSANDMSRWMITQLRSGIEPDGDTLFSPAQQAAMWTVHTPIAVSQAYRQNYPTTNFRGYGLGWSLNDYKGRRIVSHGGAYDGMYSRVVLVPELQLGVVVLTNSMSGISTAVANRMLDMYLGGDAKDWSTLLLRSEREANEREAQRRAAVLKQTLPGTSPAHPLGAYAGRYTGPMYGDVNVSLEDGRLVLRMGPRPDIVADLRHLQLETFVVDWRDTWAWFEDGVVQFQLDPAGAITGMRMDIPNQDIWFQELDLRRVDG